MPNNLTVCILLKYENILTIALNLTKYSKTSSIHINKKYGIHINEKITN